MLTGKWTPMNREITKFNSLVLETRVMSGENDENWMTRAEILYKTHMSSDFKHKSAWSFLKDKHKWKNPDPTYARRNRHRVTDEEPKLFGDDELPRPPGVGRIAKNEKKISHDTTFCGANEGALECGAIALLLTWQHFLDYDFKPWLNHIPCSKRAGYPRAMALSHDQKVLPPQHFLPWHQAFTWHQKLAPSLVTRNE
ncbi:hypothetical protein Tco_1224270, partial [Tanacetum coccineum]